MSGMFIARDLELLPVRATLGVLAGCGAAALISLVPVLPALLLGAGRAIPMLLFSFSIAFAVWLGGVLCLGLPIWALLHQAGARGAGAALLAGLLIPVLAVAVLGLGVRPGSFSSVNGVAMVVDGVRTAAGWARHLTLAGLLSVPGAAAAAVIWAMAYRPADGRGAPIRAEERIPGA